MLVSKWGMSLVTFQSNTYASLRDPMGQWPIIYDDSNC